jgi:hypothetical protein
VHIDDIGPNFDLLILPDIGAMSHKQAAALEAAVSKGVALLATGLTSAYDEWGEPRPDFALARVFGAHRTSPPRDRFSRLRAQHTYLRIGEGPRHEVLRGFDETAILPYGGELEALRIDEGATVPLTYIPAFPVYPPETAWMRTPKTDIPGLVLRTAANGARVAYLPADVDRRYARENLPDHANLLANVIRWAAAKPAPLEVHGQGLLDCNLYTQPGRVILHLVNLTNEGAWRAPIDELLPVGPFRVRVKLPADVNGRGARLLVSGTAATATVQSGWAEVAIARITDHEVIVIS